MILVIAGEQTAGISIQIKYDDTYTVSCLLSIGVKALCKL